MGHIRHSPLLIKSLFQAKNYKNYLSYLLSFSFFYNSLFAKAYLAPFFSVSLSFKFIFRPSPCKVFSQRVQIIENRQASITTKLYAPKQVFLGANSTSLLFFLFFFFFLTRFLHLVSGVMWLLSGHMLIATVRSGVSCGMFGELTTGRRRQRQRLDNDVSSASAVNVQRLHYLANRVQWHRLFFDMERQIKCD